jgi:hypothetical protein
MDSKHRGDGGLSIDGSAEVTHLRSMHVSARLRKRAFIHINHARLKEMTAIHPTSESSHPRRQRSTSCRHTLYGHPVKYNMNGRAFALHLYRGTAWVSVLQAII